MKSELGFRVVRIGKRNQLKVVREAPQGIYLDGKELGEILLPRRYVNPKMLPGESLEVFIYFDSEDRLVATTETPKACVGEIACLEVAGVNRNVGTFLDWGLPKDLLLPFREQKKPLQRGEKVVVAIYLDPETERIVASTRLQRHLSRDFPSWRAGDAVQMLIAGETPLGYSAVVEGTHAGLLYRDTVSVPIQIGQTIQGFVRGVRPNGQIDLSLDAAGYKRVPPLKMRILQALEQNGGGLEMDDDTSPEKIRETFGVSKKAFKQALGGLYKNRRIRFLRPGIELVRDGDWEPGKENRPER